MADPSRYWKILRIDAIRQGRSLPAAQEFFQRQFPDWASLTKVSPRQQSHIQDSLLVIFRTQASSADHFNCAKAGLCLRCYVSYPIVNACKRIASLFGGGNIFTYYELLPFVLDDDGKNDIVLEPEGKNQLILTEKGSPEKTNYQVFTVEILRSFNLNSESRLSLDNWAYYQTKQNQDIKTFLSDRGFEYLSDWALLNKARPQQLELLPMRDRSLVEVFHAVYRRDRRQQARKKAGKCPDPSSAQLEEMRDRLQEQEVLINSTQELMKQLKRVAKVLRQYDIWSRRGAPIAEPLEAIDPETGDYVSREFPDLNSTQEPDELEEREFLDFLRQQLLEVLQNAIESGIRDRIAAVKKSRSYAPFAPKILPALQLLYCQSLSQREIASHIGMTNQSQVSRVLNPKEILSQVRFVTVENLLKRILEKMSDLGLFDKSSNSPEDLKFLMLQIEGFVDEKIFQEATAELRAGSNRSMNSLYAQQMRRYLNENTSGVKE